MYSIRLSVLILFLLSYNSFSQSELDPIFTVVVDAGHGGKDPGNTGNGYLEKKNALSIALKL